MSWWFRLRRRRRLETDLAEEISFHKEMRSRDEGAPRFGNETLIQESMRDLWTFAWLETTLGDIRYACRGLIKSPGFSIIAIASLALGLGAVVAIFTAADDLLFRPLPFQHPDRLVMLWETNKTLPDAVHNVVAPYNFLEWKAKNAVFEDMAFVDEGRSVFSDGAHSEEVHVQTVSPNFFTMLGVTAYRGRLITPSEHDDSQVLISYRTWQIWFGGDSDVIGRRVFLDSFPRTILGVMPPGFSFGSRDVDVWPSMALDPIPERNKGPRNLNVVGLLKPGVTLEQAQKQMAGIALSLEQADPQFNKNWTVTLEPLRDAFVRGVKTALRVLLGAVSLLLVVACANVSSLLLARYQSRRPEIATRVALGAGRGRLIRQLLTENVVLAASSGALGLLLGKLALAGLVRLAPQALTQSVNIAIDFRIVLFAVGLAVLTGVLFGVAPPVIASARFSSALKGSPSRLSAGGNFRAWLIAGQIAASVVLLAGAGVLSRSLLKLQSVDSGLNAQNTLTFHFRVLSPNDVSKFSQAIAGIERLPGVRSVSATSFLPFAGLATIAPVKVEARPAPQPGEELTATIRTVMPRYFETIGIPIRRGRDFLPTENNRDAPMRFVVNEAFVRKYLPGENPLSKRISVAMARNNPFGEIVGVVGDVKEGALNKQPVPTVYFLYEHMPYGQMTLLARAGGDPTSILPSVQRIVRDLDPRLAVAEVQTMETILSETYARERFSALLMLSFSISAVMMAAIGIYGILAYLVTAKTPEIGLRMAVGADSSRIVRMVVGEAARFVTAGLLVGIAVAFAVLRLVTSQLFDTSPSDPLTFAAVPAILIIVALAAAYIPARRAARLDPMKALRVE
jgi:putative ABC transport system permease protein